MSISRTKRAVSFKNELVIKLCSFISLIAMAAMTLLFAKGFASFGGRVVNIRRAITLIFSIFKMGKAYYRTLSGLFIGLSFFIILVIMVLRFIDAYKFFAFLSFNKRDKSKIVTMGLDPIAAKEKYTFSLCALVGDNLVSVLKFQAICAIFGDDRLSREFLLIALIGVCAFVLTRSLYNVLKGCTAKTFGIGLIFNLVLLSSIAVMIIHARVPAVEGIRSYLILLPEFFNGDLGLDASLSFVALILQTLILFTAINAFRDANSFASVFNSDTKSKAWRVLILAVILVLLPVVLLIVEGEELDIDVLSSLASPYLSLLVSSFALLFASMLDVPAEKKKTARRQIGYVDARGALYISDLITRIYDDEYAERRDINVVYIPSSVKEIGRNAFYGCGAITAIYCDFPAKPEGWDRSWNNGCYATVYWRTSDGQYK